MAWKKQEGTKHKINCSRVFKNYDLSCDRCLELHQGDKPRDGWNTLKLKHEQQRSLEIRNHNCVLSHCGPVCTAFDY